MEGEVNSIRVFNQALDCLSHDGIFSYMRFVDLLIRIQNNVKTAKYNRTASIQRIYECPILLDIENVIFNDK